jgi:5,10-methenyltetrahydrofolate synthetase
MHEIDPAYSGLDSAGEPGSGAGLMRWRKAERERLISARLSIKADLRRQYATRIAATLEEEIGEPGGLVVSAYWPFRGEPDLRGFMERMTSRGARCALPLVIERGQPLVFRTWARGDPLESGIWNIPVPAKGDEVVPDVVIAPVVGFDGECYRLGYGGGFFDRTLAAMPHKPRIFGVGYAQAEIRTIYPQSHDIPMNAVVTQDGVRFPASASKPE